MSQGRSGPQPQPLPAAQGNGQLQVAQGHPGSVEDEVIQTFPGDEGIISIHRSGRVHPDRAAVVAIGRSLSCGAG